MTTSKNILDGIRVLDFSQALAGPTTTRLMAEMGAEVIKVELAPNGEASRALPYLRNGRSGYYIQQNRGKKSIAIDRKDPRSIDLVMKVLEKCDVLVENFAPGAIGRLGFGWDAVHKLNPRLIMGSISAFGQTGPLASLPGYDDVAFLAFENAQRRHSIMMSAATEGLDFAARGGVRLHVDLVAVEIGIEQRCFDVLTFAGALAIKQCSIDSGQQMGAGHHVADTEHVEIGRTVGFTDHTQHAGIGGADVIIARQRGQWAGLSEGRNRAHDQTRVDLVYRLPAEAEPADGTGREVLH